MHCLKEATVIQPKYKLMMRSVDRALPVGQQQVLKGLASKATISGYMNEYFLCSDRGRSHYQTTPAAIRSLECLDPLHHNYCQVTRAQGSNFKIYVLMC